MIPTVSIIVPAFNAETSLERCLRSIAVQTLTTFECIIVDDGSSDSSGRIADDFANKDSRFKVIHQKNSGVAVARQTGIDAAMGIYTIQFDADDWVEPQILEELVAVATETGADMVICDFYMVNVDGISYDSQKPKSLDAKIVFGQIMQQRQPTLWNKLIKKDCFKRYDLHFIPDMKIGEDQYICLCLLSNPIKIEYLPKALYYYDRTSNHQSLMAIAASPEAKMRPLELIASSVDITVAQDYFNAAVMVNAYQALLGSKSQCANYQKVFKKHLSSILHAKGYPIHVKLLVLLRIYGIYIPIQSIKKIKNLLRNWFISRRVNII